jgi:phosphoglycolate phosphatase
LVDKFMEVYGFSREEAESATADFRERYEPIGVRECRVFPGIKELLQQLIDRGFNVGIATSKPQHLAEWLLEQEGMTGLFKVVCGSSSEGNNNAKWQVLQRAMDALGAAAEDSVLVGDTKYDVEGAKRCGVPCIGVRYGYAAPGELESAGAVAIAENMDELLQLLTK